jgi:hypothetical protein
MRRLPLWKSSLALSGAVVLTVALTAGCGRTQTQEKTYNTQTYNQQQNAALHNDQGGDVIRREAPPGVDRDTLMGRNQNPNLIIGHQNVRNTQVDMDNMVKMARSVPGVENARITLSGGNAYITLDLAPNVTASQARSIEQQVITALQQKAPRYDFHLTSNEGYHR